MTEAQLAQRDFLLIAFSRRESTLYRRDKQEFRLSVSDNVTGEVLKRVRSQAAQGHYVLVFEFGVIKSDWCKLDEVTFHLLATLTDNDFRHFFANVIKVYFSHEEFTGHLIRSFPSLAAQYKRR